ncbi:hypothetical protein O3P69_006392 [Scylla paramamosain]|uniref:Uncharacterized protein n=1 Tax=Scylla paramamosain TaxID=85552 RepID=A0AAW0U2F4_SCYPA
MPAAPRLSQKTGRGEEHGRTQELSVAALGASRLQIVVREGVLRVAHSVFFACHCFAPGRPSLTFPNSSRVLMTGPA